MPLDAWLVRCLPAPGSMPPFDALMMLASTVGLVVPVLLIPWRIRARDPRLARALLLGLTAGLLGTLVLQQLSARPRPPSELALLPVPPLPSFPSGHAALLAIVLVAQGADRPRSLLGWAPLGLLVAISRVHVGHHHPTDVLGGCLLGLGIGAGVVIRARARVDDPWRHRWLLWPQLGLVLAISLVAYTGALASGRIWWLRVPGMDKVLHFLLFGLLALGVHLHARGRRLALGRLRLPVAVLVPLLGASAEELVQAASPFRTADLGDLLADLLGLVAFWWGGEVLTRRPPVLEAVAAPVVTSAPRRPGGRRGAGP